MEFLLCLLLIFNKCNKSPLIWIKKFLKASRNCTCIRFVCFLFQLVPFCLLFLCGCNYFNRRQLNIGKNLIWLTLRTNKRENKTKQINKHTRSAVIWALTHRHRTLWPLERPLEAGAVISNAKTIDRPWVRVNCNCNCGCYYLQFTGSGLDICYICKRIKLKKANARGLLGRERHRAKNIFRPLNYKIGFKNNLCIYILFLLF